MAHYSFPTLQMVPPVGETLVVAGGCGGIGRSLVEMANEIGLKVFVLDLQRSIDAFPVSQGVTAIACDATKPTDIVSAFEGIAKNVNAIDHFVNLVGFTKEQVNIADMADEEWDEIIEGTLKSAFLLVRAAIPLLRKSANPSILNTASTFGVHVPVSGYGPYSVAKAGIVNFTRVLAIEEGPHIRVNALAPGLIDTQFLKGGTGRAEKSSRIDENRVVTTIPLQRIGTPDDLVGMMLFLASPAASYITSQTMHVNGGLWS